MSIGKWSFAFYWPTVWNSLPSALSDNSLSLNTFKQREAYISCDSVPFFDVAPSTNIRRTCLVSCLLNELILTSFAVYCKKTEIVAGRINLQTGHPDKSTQQTTVRVEFFLVRYNNIIIIIICPFNKTLTSAIA